MAIPITLRKKIADFDPIREGITVQQFCKNIGVSKQTYYNIKARIAERGRAGIVPDSTAPLNPRRVYDDKIRQQVLQARGTLQARGQDCGPWSIFYFFLDEVPRVLFLGVCLDFYYFLWRVLLPKFGFDLDRGSVFQALVEPSLVPP